MSTACSYDEALRSGGENDPAVALEVVRKLPEANVRTLRHCVALMAELASYESVNKMSMDNTAMVFAPNILRIPTNDPMLLARNQESEKRFVLHLVSASTWAWR